jgi:hypothetical protein
VNLTFFEAVKPISLPYFDNRMCEFICSVPEKYLANRQIQIEYIKLRNPGLAKITWQDQRPFNLYNYKWNHSPWNIPYLIIQKIKREWITKNTVRNNYENQFFGDSNDAFLQQWLFENDEFSSFINPELVHEFYTKFKTKNSLLYSHPVSTLLTLSLFCKLKGYEK